MSSHERSQRVFATTRWSMVIQTAGTTPADAGGALIELVQRYWYPVFAYARRSGNDPAVAQEINPASDEHEAIEQRLNSRPLALVVALKRLRQRFRELVGVELADTVTSSEDLAAEQRTLHSVLHD